MGVVRKSRFLAGCALLLGSALAALAWAWFAGQGQAQSGAETATTHRAGRIDIDVPSLVLAGRQARLAVRPHGERFGSEALLEVHIGGVPALARKVSVRDERGALLGEVVIDRLELPGWGTHSLRVSLGGVTARRAVRVIPGWLSLLPPLFAIGLAIVFREVLLALFAGVWLGASAVYDGRPFIGLLRAVDHYAVGALADPDHAAIVAFTLLLGGMVGIVVRSGGAAGLADVVTRMATTRFRGALATWLLGLVVFFDDYANCLLVGSTMRPISDRLRISREKLSFLVDATAAPVSSFALVSSWVGVEVGYIADQYASLGLEQDAYLVFLATIPYRFYPILMLFFGLMVIVMRRDFGPMLRAERRAIETGALMRKGAEPPSDFESDALRPPEGTRGRWANAAVPILVVVVVALGGMVVDGRQKLLAERATVLEVLKAPPVAQRAEARRQLALLDVNLRNMLGHASSTKALLWASFFGGVCALLMALTTGVLPLRKALDAWVSGAKSIALAVMILVLAWSLGQVCRDLHTADFVVGAVGSWLSPSWLPAMVFVVSALVSFATGTSWGTMGVLFPLAIPLAHELAPQDPGIVLSAVASILTGSVWGDHCSPISDTTIMSSMAASCDHVDHVRTQVPYALWVGGISLLVGEIAGGFGLLSPWASLAIGAIALALLVRWLGRPVEMEAT